MQNEYKEEPLGFIDELRFAQKYNESLLEYIRQLACIQSMCGTPDAAEGCRNILAYTKTLIETYQQKL